MPYPKLKFLVLIPAPNSPPPHRRQYQQRQLLEERNQPRPVICLILDNLTCTKFKSVNSEMQDNVPQLINLQVCVCIFGDVVRVVVYVGRRGAWRGELM